MTWAMKQPFRKFLWETFLSEMFLSEMFVEDNGYWFNIILIFNNTFGFSLRYEQCQDTYCSDGTNFIINATNGSTVLNCVTTLYNEI